MPSTTSHYGITYSLASDEVEKFPAEVSAVGAKRIDEVLYERFLSVQEHSSPFSAKSGELVKCTGAIVVTLPSVTANAIVGVLANNHGVEVERTGAAKIYGDFVEGESKIKLVGYQHVVLQSDGTNWYIIAGEPTDEAVYGGSTSRAANTEYEASSTRQVFVVLNVEKVTGARGQIEVGGVTLTNLNFQSTTQTFGFICPAGAKWKTGAECEGITSNYLRR